MEMREVLDGRLAATFVCEAECLDLSGAPAPWPQAAVQKATALMTPLPDHARPRGLAPDIIDRDVSVARADALAMFESNRSAVHPYECDAGGRMGPRFFLARVSDAQGHMWARAGLGRHDQLAAGLATATVEMRFLFFKKPVAGELLVMRTGLVEAAEKTLRYRHWLFNAETGEPAFAAEGLGLLFDRGTRKAVPIPEAVAKNFADA
jgi:acyl-CoA thioester hydrolase